MSKSKIGISDMRVSRIYNQWLKVREKWGKIRPRHRNMLTERECEVMYTTLTLEQAQCIYMGAIKKQIK